jgi:hypothetical protein
MELKVVVPTSLSEITLDQYQRFARLQGDEEFLTHKMLEIFCGLPLADLPNVRIKSVSHVTKHVQRNVGRKAKSLKPTFTLGKQTFGFVPNLEDITFGEYVDLDNYMSSTADLHKTMAVLYRPVTNELGKRYDIEPYESAERYCETMKQAPMDVVLGATLFFYRLGNDLLNATTRSLENPQMNTLLSRSLEENGDGILRFITSLKVTSEPLKKLEDWAFTNASPFSRLTKRKQKSKESKLKN